MGSVVFVPGESREQELELGRQSRQAVAGSQAAGEWVGGYK